MYDNGYRSFIISTIVDRYSASIFSLRLQVFYNFYYCR